MIKFYGAFKTYATFIETSAIQLHCLNHVSPFQYCDFARGFLVFEKDSSFHVWRRCRDATADPLYPQPGPSPLQQDVFEKSMFTTLSSSQDNRGVFVPYTVITPPKRPYNSRLLYPTLLVSTIQHAEGYLYNIRAARYDLLS